MTSQGHIAFFDELTDSFDYLSYLANTGFVTYNLRNAEMTHKIAAFDYDSTLARPKESRPFPKDVSDWEWLYPKVPTVLCDYAARGYTIVIFTNQSKLWKHTQIITALGSLTIPLFICVAMDKQLYKPNPTMANELFADIHINRKKSFFVGDALGGSNFSDCDKLFAEAINFKCFSPEEMFYDAPDESKLEQSIINVIPKNENTRMIILIGYPGSGKSTVSKAICSSKKDSYCTIEKDILKTKTKIFAAIHNAINNKISPIIDETNPTIESREQYIQIAKTHNLPVLIIHVSTEFDESYNRNKSRIDSKQVPKIVYYKYRKSFVAPNIAELEKNKCTGIIGELNTMNGVTWREICNVTF